MSKCSDCSHARSWLWWLLLPLCCERHEQPPRFGMVELFALFSDRRGAWRYWGCDWQYRGTLDFFSLVYDHTRKTHHITLLKKQGARFRAPDLHLSGAQFTTESVDSTSGQLWTSASVVTDAFFTALNLTSSNRNFVEVAGGGYGEVVGLRYTHAYWVKWNSESSNARTLFRGRTDRWAQLQAGT